ncbi:hypothetical protein [Winogradskyella ursingii]|uniref:hypothetical protein n=1 Tax=Winogradskyella ursingii TaxID=2686079 RepID=UPI0015C9E83D|nr:hypothetical protein [Winogradskyella ursingii]
MNKIIIVFGFLLLFNCKSTKYYTYNNNKDVEKIKSVSDYTKLEIDMVAVPFQKLEINSSQELIIANSLSTALVSLVGNIPKYVTQFIETEKQRYTATYKARNSLKENIESREKHFYLPQITLTKSFVKEGKDFENIPATCIILKPHLVQSKFLAFTIEDLEINYSKAKLTKDYPIVNMLIEIKATTIDSTNAKKELIAKPMIITHKVGDYKWFKRDDYKTYFSDTFSTEGIIDFEVKITEINPKKVSLENLEKILTDNKDDLANLFKAISDAIKD